MARRQQIQLTKAEYAKISAKSAKNGYGFSRAQLDTMAKRHYNGDDRTKAIIEAQLEDVNYHTEAAALSRDNYRKFEKEVDKNYGALKKRPQIYQDIENARKSSPQYQKRAAYRAQRKAQGLNGG